MSNIISRDAAEALIQEQVQNTVFQDVPKESAFLRMARRLPNMTSKQTRLPVLDLLPMAYWVNGDNGIKQTSRQEWENVYLTAAELAVIVPLPEAVLDDASFDIVGEVTPRVTEAIGQRVDSAAIFGVNRPAEWQSDIVTLARQAGNNVACTGGTITYDKLMAEDGLLAKVEEGGYPVTGVLAAMNTRAKLRSIKDTASAPIFMTGMQGETPYSLGGAPMYFPQNGSFDTSIAQMIAGDFSQAVYAIRQDVTVKILDQATIVDPSTKEIVYALAQQDMIAIRVVFRMGWALPNPATRLNQDRTFVPFAYLEPSSSISTQDVTFTVKDGSTLVADAIVNVNGARKKTDSTGVATFTLTAGSYPYTVKKAGYKTINNYATVASADVDIAVAATKS